MMKRQRTRKLVLLGLFLVFPITLNYFSPFLLLEGAAQGIVVASLFLWVAFFVTSLFVGRAGCSYFCPLGGLQMIKESVAPKELKQVRRLRATKFVLFFAWAGALVAILVTKGFFTRVQPLYMMPKGISIDSIGGLMTYFMLVGIVLLPLLLGRRGFCRYFCPFSVINIAGTKIKNALGYPSLHLSSAPSQCAGCGKCDKACPMSLKVSEMVSRNDMEDSECILCASCVDTCPKKAIKYAVRRGPVCYAAGACDIEQDRHSERLSA
jgi:ferredoxin-type protein NapH